MCNPGLARLHMISDLQAAKPQVRKPLTRHALLSGGQRSALCFTRLGTLKT